MEVEMYMMDGTGETRCSPTHHVHNHASTHSFSILTRYRHTVSFLGVCGGGGGEIYLLCLK